MLAKVLSQSYWVLSTVATMSHMHKLCCASCILLSTLVACNQITKKLAPTNLLNIVFLKLSELGSWNFYRMFTPHHVLHVTCHVSHVSAKCQVLYLKCHMSYVTFSLNQPHLADSVIESQCPDVCNTEFLKLLVFFRISRWDSVPLLMCYQMQAPHWSQSHILDSQCLVI